MTVGELLSSLELEKCVSLAVVGVVCLLRTQFQG